MTSLRSWLVYIIVAITAVFTAAATENEAFDNDVRIVQGVSVGATTSNGGSSNMDSNNDDKMKSIKELNERSVINKLTPNDLNNGLVNSNKNSIINRASKRMTTRGQNGNDSEQGRNLQTTSTAGKGNKGKDKNVVESTCDLEVSTCCMMVGILLKANHSKIP